MESKWRLNRWLYGINGEDQNILYARFLGFAFPFILRSAGPGGVLYTVGHFTVQPGEVSDDELRFVVDGTFDVPDPPLNRFPYGIAVEPDHM